MSGNGCHAAREAALKYHAAGYSVCTINDDGSKFPPGKWGHLQTTRMTEAEVQQAFHNGLGVGIVCGAVSGGGDGLALEVIDCDDASILDGYLGVVTSHIPDFRERFPMVRTPRGGAHFPYRTRVIAGNTKLAMRPAKSPEEKDETLIETRGQGGLVVAPGSPPACHPTRGTYIHESGPPITEAPLISDEERDILHGIARTFDEVDVVEEQPREPRGAQAPGSRPGDEYARAKTWEEILEPHGWKVHHRREGVVYWTRPAKDTKLGHSATTGFCKSKTTGEDLLKVFSSAAYPFQVGKCYGRFAAYAILNHGGDFAAAGRALAAAGYGSRGVEWMGKVENSARNETSTSTSTEPGGKGNAFEPFPLDALPGVLRDYSGAVAEAMGCDPAAVAVPLLPVTAGCIGNTRSIILKDSWSEPAIIWGAIVSNSGTSKSPALHAALNPVNFLQGQRIDENDAEFEAWEARQREYREARSSRRKGEPPIAPPDDEEPKAIEYITDDITTESLAGVLRDNPRGLLAAQEELSGFFAGMGAYKDGRATLDVSRWLRMYDGRSFKVNRKTGERKDKLINVRRAAVSLTGTIQPGLLAKCVTEEHHDSGLMARFILAMPPVIREEWTEASVPQEIDEKYAVLVYKLLHLRGLREDGHEPGPGEKVRSVCPQGLPLCPEAKALWIEFFNSFRFEEEDQDPRQSALWAKSLGRAARLALVHHVVSEVAAGREAVTPVTAKSIDAGIRLARWSLKEGMRVYSRLRSIGAERTSDDPETREDIDLCEYMRTRGARCTVDDLEKGPRRFRKDPKKGRDIGPKERLERLVRKGYATIIIEDTGGRQRTVFALVQTGGGCGCESF